MSIGENIKKQRKHLGLTLEELANKIGTTRQTVYKYENGIVQNIPSDKIEMIASALNTTPSYIMGWEKNENTNIELDEVTKKAITRIKNRRNELKLSFKDLSEQTGISEYLLKRFESPKIGNISVSKISSLASALNLPPTYLIGLSDDPYEFETDHFKEYLKILDYIITYDDIKNKYLIYNLRNPDEKFEISREEFIELKDSNKSHVKFKLSEINDRHLKFNLKEDKSIEEVTKEKDNKPKRIDLAEELAKLDPIETVAAHNDHWDEPGEMEKMMRDIERIKQLKKGEK
nr:helix-turn-helix domain-containing protein [Clostridioides sp.]